MIKFKGNKKFVRDDSEKTKFMIFTGRINQKSPEAVALYR
jgi:hypothetical protein